MNKSQLKLIVFDIGGVMIQLAKDFKEACNWAGVTYRSFEYTASMEERRFINEMDYESGQISSQKYFHELRNIFDPYSLEEIEAIHMAYINKEFEGIKDIIITLKSKGYLTACLSNTSVSHWNELSNPDKYPSIGLLDYKGASFKMGLVKPDKEIYKAFERDVKVYGSSILFFDDRQDNIEVAEECGWNVVQIKKGVSSAEQIKGALQRLFDVDLN